MRVMLWDVRVGGDRRLQLLKRVDADLLLLLGVSKASGRAWSQRWRGRYHTTVGLDLVDSVQSRPHGAMIASRWPVLHSEVVTELPRPERGLVAQIGHPGRTFTAVSWGTPNAAGDGREAKMSAYRSMMARLKRLPAPIVVGIDTNSWGDAPLRDASPPADDHPFIDEHRFLSRDAAHGLRDVHRTLVDADPARLRLLADLYPHGPLATTFIRRPHGRPRSIAHGFDAGLAFGLDRMDRLFVSSDIKPLACEHLYHEAIAAGGDHAAVIADVDLGAR